MKPNELECQECGGELKEVDYFGKLLCSGLFAVPMIDRKGVIYQCEECGEHYYMLDEEGKLRCGYPC